MTVQLFSATNSAISNFHIGIPDVQQLGTLVITSFALNVLSNMPMVSGKEVPGENEDPCADLQPGFKQACKFATGAFKKAKKECTELCDGDDWFGWGITLIDLANPTKYTARTACIWSCMAKKGYDAKFGKNS